MGRRVGWLAVVLWFLPVVAAAGDLEVRDAWVAESPPTVQVSAAYMIIRNAGTTGRTVVGASSPLFAKVEFHESVQRGGMVSMVARDSLVVDAGGQVVLKPGGYHMMLIAPPRPLRVGEKVPLVLHLSDGAKVTVEAEVRAAKGSSGEHSHHHAH
ncbi:MAG: copper chaperone PCu(A)C [Magnetococcus sp. YQC-3]